MRRPAEDGMRYVEREGGKTNAKPNASDPMNTPISLNDYRWQFPNTARVPTLTQRGLVGGMLERHERRAARRAWRRAMLSRILGWPLDGAAWLWHWATTPPTPTPARTWNFAWKQPHAR